MKSILELLRAADLVFWDFDGVIKESVEVKADGFERLFMPYGADLAARVRQHHELHRGVSRYEKIPVYLEWVGGPPTTARVEEFCVRFSTLVQQAVIDADWVPGVREYIDRNHDRQRSVLLTATPQDEMSRILESLEIAEWFAEIHGAPTTKGGAILDVLTRSRCAPAMALMVGDSRSDLQAAQMNGVPFVLRRTPLNRDLQREYDGPAFDDLSSE